MREQTQALITEKYNTGIIERVLIVGDLSKLQPDERVSYYRAVCKSVGLNPFTQPFAYINLQGKLTLYAKKDCTEQLRKIHNVSVTKLERDTVNGVYIVTAYARLHDGRQDSSTGAVNTEGLKGDALANAIMKAETKAKRRVTLSICGLGFLDETEVETTPGHVVNVRDTGEIESEPPLKDDYSAKQNDKAMTDHNPQWPGQVVTWAVRKWNLKPQQVIGALNKGQMIEPGDPDTAIQEWLSVYREARNTVDGDEAAKQADDARKAALDKVAKQIAESA